VVDAFSLNFHVAVLSDCVYDRGRVTHYVNLFDMASKYADVLSLTEALGRLPAPRAPAASD
jgi:isochorismate hydrolase